MTTEPTGHLPEVQRWGINSITGAARESEGGRWVKYSDHVAALRACEARVREAERDEAQRILVAHGSERYTIGYAVGQADMRKYLLADDTHSYTYGHRAALDAARDAVLANPLKAVYPSIVEQLARDIDALKEKP